MGGPHGKTGTKQNQIIQTNTNTLTQGKSGKKNKSNYFHSSSLPDVRKRLTIVINPFLCGSGGSAQLKLHPKCHKEPQLSGIFMPLCLLTHTEFFINEKLMETTKLEA